MLGSLRSLKASILILRVSSEGTSEEEEEFRKGLLWMWKGEEDNEEDGVVEDGVVEDGVALKSIPSSSSVYDLCTRTSLSGSLSSTFCAGR